MKSHLDSLMYCLRLLELPFKVERLEYPLDTYKYNLLLVDEHGDGVEILFDNNESCIGFGSVEGAK